MILFFLQRSTIKSAVKDLEWPAVEKVRSRDLDDELTKMNFTYCGAFRFWKRWRTGKSLQWTFLKARPDSYYKFSKKRNYYLNGFFFSQIEDTDLIFIRVVSPDVDECVNNKGMKTNVCINGECQNTMKDYICVCNPGYKSDVTKKLCNGIQWSFIRHSDGRTDRKTDRQTDR